MYMQTQRWSFSPAFGFTHESNTPVRSCMINDSSKIEHGLVDCTRTPAIHCLCKQKHDNVNNKMIKISVPYCFVFESFGILSQNTTS